MRCQRNSDGMTGSSVWTGMLVALCTVTLVSSALGKVNVEDLGNSPLRVLILGGGPSVQHNQVAIESNVRYLGKLLPPNTQRTTLFADGDPASESVLYTEDILSLPPAERAVALVTQGDDTGFEESGKLRRPNLGAKLDGADKLDDVSRAFSQISHETSNPPKPLLLYVTGHGSPSQSNLDNNIYNLWGKHEALSVRELAKQISQLPPDRQVVVIMVQCFSGAFGNLIFEGGNPQGRAVNRDIAGFFATDQVHVAAGCTPAVNEADYHDFTSYFFAALSGRDRLGRKVSGADYNGDGHVDMYEAFIYTLIHDASVDIPVCTSDVFLRRYVKAPEDEVLQTSFSQILSWATPVQRIALNALSDDLHLSGEARLPFAYREAFAKSDPDGKNKNKRDQATAFFETIRREKRRSLLRRFPELSDPGGGSYDAARKRASQAIAAELRSGGWQDLLDAYAVAEKENEAAEAFEIKKSHYLRFVRLAKSAVLAHWLQQNNDMETRARYARLVQAETKTLLPPASSWEADPVISAR